MIPTSKDVRAVIGDWAEGVDNRSLLYAKFSLPKIWGQTDGRKLDDAGRWSVLRIVSRGGDLLKADAESLERRARGRNVQPHNSDRMGHAAQMARKLSVIAKPDPALPKTAAENTRRLLAALGHAYEGRVVTFEATLGARLLVNLAGGVVENAGICLDRCFGLPFLPGSAVKGIARSQALWKIHEASAADKPRLLGMALTLFGFGANDLKRDGDFGWAAGDPNLAKQFAGQLEATDFKGAASFLPAYPASEPKLVVDMVNPHYPEYYRGKRQRATDDENPIPNYCPAVEAGASFGFAVLLNRVPERSGFTAEELLQSAREWVEGALTQKGAGAKTAAGYGWFALGRTADAAAVSLTTASASVPSGSPCNDLIQKWRGRLTTKDNFPVALPDLAQLSDVADLRRAFEALIPEAERRRTRKNSPYWQAFTSGRQGETGKNILQRLGINLT